MNSELVVYQNARDTVIFDGVERDRHVKVSIGHYADTQYHFEIFVVRPKVLRTRHEEALAFVLTHIQDLGLHPARVRGIYVKRATVAKEPKPDIEGKTQRGLF